MKPTFQRILLLALLPIVCAALAGCVSTGRNFDESKISEIKKGETTEADLVKLFGQPERRSVNSEGTTHLSWHYMESRMKARSYIPLPGVPGGSDSKHKMLVVTLGADGKVTHFTSSGGGSETRHTM